MAKAAGVRIGWADLPPSVQSAVEDVIGDTVVEAVSQPGGFSPGTADRVRTATGRRAFVKAVSSAQNPDSPRLHRREARVTAALPPWAPVPDLLGFHDDGDWVALVLSDVDGRHPRTPWDATELHAVLRTLRTLADQATPVPLPDLPAAADSLSDDLASWTRLADDPPPHLHPWAAANLDALQAAADRAIAVLDGDTLVHLDVRADNLLIGPAGVTVVDWPWACRGPSWLDSAMLLVNVRLHGGHDCAALLTDIAAAHNADRADLLTFLAGIAGFFTDYARRPPPPGLPTVRAFQRAQSEALLDWLAEERPVRGR